MRAAAVIRIVVLLCAACSELHGAGFGDAGTDGGLDSTSLGAAGGAERGGGGGAGLGMAGSVAGSGRPVDASIDNASGDGSLDGEALAPTIVSVQPKDGSDDVRPDASIVIRFSQPMDRTRTLLAYQSPDLSISDVDVAWNGDSMELTLRPRLPLQTTDANAGKPARKYTFGFGDGARDQRGNSLSPAMFSFKTLRRWGATLPLVADLSTILFVRCAPTSCSPIVSRADSSISYRADYGSDDVIGDVAITLEGPTRSVALFTFDVSGLPGGLTSFESASLLITSGRIVGDVAGLGNMTLERVQFARVDLDSIPAESADRTALVAPGQVITTVAPKSNDLLRFDTTTMLYDRYASRTKLFNRAQFRLQFMNTVFPANRVGLDDNGLRLRWRADVALQVEFLAK
jgi:hypothetical protein